MLLKKLNFTSVVIETALEEWKGRNDDRKNKTEATNLTIKTLYYMTLRLLYFIMSSLKQV